MWPTSTQHGGNLWSDGDREPRQRAATESRDISLPGGSVAMPEGRHLVQESARTSTSIRYMY
ncbi:MAG: hypothetical protein OJF49_002791 [Ktedonobacterales bacterium]|nr:MAG: hypothetical protein OJF49_002791 [Ktedonobacterales bacterium]